MPNNSAVSKLWTARTSRDLARIAMAVPASVLTLAAASLAGAQVPRDTVLPPAITSMGQPPLWQPYGSIVGTFGRNNDAVGGVVLGLFHPRGSPVTGLFGLSGEAYLLATSGSGGPTGGARLLGVTRAINLGYGIDWDARENNFAFMLSLNTAVRRGGLLGHGTTLRVDWIPSRGSGLDVGITVPLAQRYAGRTRPHHTSVSLRDIAPTPSAEVSAPYSLAVNTTLPANADTALGRLREAAALIAAYSNFFSEKHEKDRKKDLEKIVNDAKRVRATIARVSPEYPEGRTFLAAERVYAASLTQAFASAVHDTTLGKLAARRAREGLLTHVLIPYDALFGRDKKDDDDLSPLLNVARADFRGWLTDSLGVSSDRRFAAVKVHDALLATVIAAQHHILSQWGDSRRVWLPMQLALTPEEHDDQAEVDELIARVVGRPVTSGNEITYLHEDRIQIEIARTLVAARNYHVLWIHDYAGRRPSGAVDRVGFAQTANAYFPALTKAVQRYDSTGQLTTFLIFLDQNFYEPAKGRLWMTILEDPLGAKIKLPKGNDSLAAILHARQKALRDAVAGSRRLQTLAARYGGDAWLRRTVKVHVNITQPSDFTFRSHHIISGVPLLPDNLMRDHRKIAFYDVTETDPYRGGMVLSGVGVGEHYATPTWEDRGLLVRGPAVLEVRAAARRLLKLNDFSDADIPLPLRETPRCRNCASAAGSTEGDVTASTSELGRAIQVHNEPGFGRKQASIARAMLYTLAPRGSVIIAPDGLWLESGWAGMLAGAALRGCRVYIVGPAIANAPAPGFPQMSRTQEVFVRLLQVRHEFMDNIHNAGGELRIGLYATTEDVNDIAQQARATRAGVERYPWLKDLFPLPPSVLAVFDSAPGLLERAGYRPFELGHDEKRRLPQLHRKTQFVADSAALARLTSRPEWREVAIQAMIASAKRAQRGTKTGLYDDSVTAAGTAAVGNLLQAYFASRPPADSARMTFYFTVGTQNQDPRGMLLDGEAVFVLSGMSGAQGLIDLYSLLARSTWLETQEDLDRLLPPYKTWQRRVGRFARLVL